MGVLRFNSITSAEQGEYMCSATNDVGTVTATASLKVEGMYILRECNLWQCNYWTQIIIDEHLHQCNLFHNFIEFTKAFDCVWHDGLLRLKMTSTAITELNTIWKSDISFPVKI
jgi:hypothetical protein